MRERNERIFSAKSCEKREREREVREGQLLRGGVRANAYPEPDSICQRGLLGFVRRTGFHYDVPTSREIERGPVKVLKRQREVWVHCGASLPARHRQNQESSRDYRSLRSSFSVPFSARQSSQSSAGAARTRPGDASWLRATGRSCIQGGTQTFFPHDSRAPVVPHHGVCLRLNDLLFDS